MNQLQHITFIFIILLLTSLSLNAQSWKQLSKTGNAAFKAGNYLEAAQSFEAAFHAKKSKTNLAYQSGEAYLLAYDYVAAEKILSNISQSKDFPLYYYYLGKSLKGQSKYKKAKTAFQSFLDHYKKDQRLIDLTKNEIAGCLLNSSEATNINVSKLDDAINSDGNEFAPIAFDAGILYFSSDRDQSAKLFRSRLSGGKWSSAIEPKLPNVDGQIVQGSFSENTQRFYFTVYNGQSKWNGHHTDCDIYVTTRQNNQWSTPQKLRDYIKMDGSTAMHPFVITQGDQEILFFTSNRPDGFGGMDIWYTTRSVSSEVFDFTFPINLGPEVNTLGDEITPFYDKMNQELYFSSNGHPSKGGFDIFLAKGNIHKWQSPKHLSSPFNSSANDFGYTILKENGQVFFVSNRAEEGQSTSQTDIYTTTSESTTTKLTISGKVSNSENKDIQNFQASLYEILNNGRSRLLVSKNFKTTYELPILSDKSLRIVITKKGFDKGEYSFNTFESTEPVLQNIQLTKAKATTPVVASRPSSYKRPVVTDKPSSSSSVKTSSPSTENKNIAYNGTYFKVQATVVIKFNPEDPIYDALRQYGSIETEYLAEKGWLRILITPFFSIREARDVIKKIQAIGYKDAFPVRYVDGNRMTP